MLSEDNSPSKSGEVALNYAAIVQVKCHECIAGTNISSGVLYSLVESRTSSSEGKHTGCEFSHSELGHLFLDYVAYSEAFTACM